MVNSETYRQYYEQDCIWQRHSPSDLEWSRVLETVDMIPSEVKSVVDVGCGDGLLTNYLLGKYERVLGIDVSNEALQYVKTEKIIGSIDNIPLPDHSFDLVLCTEVLEHLPCTIYEKAIEELQRITRTYLLISVPNDENLRDRFVKCPVCQCTYHRYRHLRSYDLGRIKNLFPSFEYVEHKYMGGLTVRPYTWETILRQNLADHWNVSGQCICPQCGYNGSGPLKRGLLSYILAALRRILPQKRKPHWLAVMYRLRDE